MALISDLVSAIAEVEGIPEGTVGLAARYAREAGYLSSGARGRNAPRATIADCANLLIAVNGSGCAVKDAPTAVELFRGLRCHAPHGSRTPVAGVGVQYTAIEDDELRFLDRHRDATFGEMLESIIDRFVGGELESFMKGQAAQYLGDPFYEAAAREAGDDPKAIARKIAEVCDLALKMDTVSFVIEMHRPIPFARLVIDRSMGAERELIAGASFIMDAEDLVQQSLKDAGGDRRERTTFGYRTFMKIAEVMRR
jgi:hypothetical protein